LSSGARTVCIALNYVPIKQGGPSEDYHQNPKHLNVTLEHKPTNSIALQNS